MDKEPKLKTELKFTFNIENMEFDDLDFLSDDPKEKTDKEIKIVKKEKSRRKSSPKLF